MYMKIHLARKRLRELYGWSTDYLFVILSWRFLYLIQYKVALVNLVIFTIIVF